MLLYVSESCVRVTVFLTKCCYFCNVAYMNNNTQLAGMVQHVAILVYTVSKTQRSTARYVI
jgi:hypothetical protein